MEEHSGENEELTREFTIQTAIKCGDTYEKIYRAPC
jgi:hypothetical protein